MSQQQKPAAGARDQVARLLTLVPFLHHRDSVRLDEAAQLLGTTPEQVLRDLKVLFMCGLPGGLPDDLIDVDLDAIQTDEGSVRADGVIRIDNAGYLARPLRLSPTEASAMIVALRSLRDASRGDTVAVVDGVLAKLEAAVAAGGSSAGQLDLAPSPNDAEQARLAVLGQRLDDAAAAGRQLRLTYWTASRAEVSERVVDPRGVVHHGVFAYLDAWCHLAEGERLFRLDRIKEAEVLETAITTPRQPPRDLADGLFDPTDPGSTVVTLRLAREAMWACEYYPVREVRPLAEGGADVDLVVADRRWLTRLLLRLAPHATVLDPPHFKDLLTTAAREALALYR